MVIRLLPTVSLIVFLALSGAHAGPLALRKSSLSDSDLESAETRLTLEQTLQELQKLKEENLMLREKQAVSDAAAGKMTETVAEAKCEAEVFRRQAGEFKLRLEALGPAAGSGNTGKLEERLLDAVSNYQHAEAERQKLAASLAGLADVAAKFAKSTSASGDPAGRLALEAQMRQASELLGKGSPDAVEGGAAPATLTDGMVISIKEELGLIVANVGSSQGVTVGMPFQVIRNDHLVGTVRVVDARERIAGAVIQDLSSEKDKIKVGDRLKIAARQ